MRFAIPNIPTFVAGGLSIFVSLAASTALAAGAFSTGLGSSFFTFGSGFSGAFVSFSGVGARGFLGSGASAVLGGAALSACSTGGGEGGVTVTFGLCGSAFLGDGVLTSGSSFFGLVTAGSFGAGGGFGCIISCCFTGNGGGTSTDGGGFAMISDFLIERCGITGATWAVLGGGGPINGRALGAEGGGTA